MGPVTEMISGTRVSSIRVQKTIAALFLLAVVFIAAGCGDSKEESTDATPATTTPATSTPAADGTVSVSLVEYKVKPSATSVKAGKVTFKVKNDGTMEHEFLVLKTDLAEDKLPTKPKDASRVDEEGEGVEAIGEVPELEPGKSGSVTLNLKPGNYVLLCNVAGHYAAGQHISFKVE